MNTNPFTPAYNKGVSITAGAASANSSVDLTKRPSIVVTNTGSDLVYVRTGSSTVVATSADYPVLGGSQVVLGKDPEDTHLAVIAPSGAPVIKAIVGFGI